ncbi:DapH/DapD/GlmU-related protein [Aeromonas veronii]|uniref:DapH/DapD/GlmU-related protein n=1 Tax=Aeromonas veronii TaxID=654 RepID=UPI0019330C39|nr:DapH/DapD/GlmU-related protein [Aeromonas veronii]MBM0415982.1 transferase [Aeromonas veronii]MBW3789166.1 transferase [Aeromonas veronii]
MIKRYVLLLTIKLLPVSRFFHTKRLLLKWAGVDIGNNVSFCGGGGIYGNGNVMIGDDTWFSPGCTIFSHVDINIRIGARCDFGPLVKIIPGTHMIGNSSRRAGKGMALPITIGDGCWIGADVLIIGGVNIGNGVVVAAGSVVTRDVPDNVLVAGVPAVIKRALQ